MNIKIPTKKEPYILTDTSVDDIIYVGTSQKGNQPDKPCWKIKKMWLDGGVWKMGFPNTKQTFSFVWDNRESYTYN